VGQDEGGVAGERTQHLDGGSVVQVVEAAPQRLAVQRDDPPPWRGGSVSKLLGMVAEGGLDLGRVERVEEGAQGVDGGRATKAGTEGGVEPLAMHADEQADAAVGGRAGEDGQHREEQQGSEAVTLTLAAARVGDLFQSGEQPGERHHAASGARVWPSTAQGRCRSLGHTTCLHEQLGLRTEQPWAT
jgi:hypothetical protein